MSRVIVASSPMRGHLTPLRAIARGLVRRGHEVVVTSGSAFREGIEATGARFVPIGGAADFDGDARQKERDRRFAMPSGPAKFASDLQALFIEPIPTQHITLQALLAESDEPTAVLVDNGFLGVWPVLVGAPGRRPEATITVGISPLSLMSVDTPPFGLGLPPDASPEGRVRNAALNAQVRAGLADVQQSLQAAFDQVRGGIAPSILDGQVQLPDRYLQLAPQSVEYPRSDAPSTLRFIGPLPAESKADVALPSWWPEVEQAEHIVVVTQGTAANADLTALTQPTLDALADRADLLVVAATGRDNPSELTAPLNARVGGFVPFESLFPRAALLVTNGGYGGSLQALAHGMPLVLAGDTEDKVEGTARLAWSGAGINLATGRPTVAALREAITTVLSDGRFAEAARRVQAEIASHDPYGDIASTIDELLSRDRQHG